MDNVLYASLGANEGGIVPYVSPESIELRPGDGILPGGAERTTLQPTLPG